MENSSQKFDLQMFKDKFGDVVVDTENNCIDRKTALGQYFDESYKALDKEANQNETLYMRQILAFAEAALILDAVGGDETAERLQQLKDSMEHQMD